MKHCRANNNELQQRNRVETVSRKTTAACLNQFYSLEILSLSPDTALNINPCHAE